MKILVILQNNKTIYSTKNSESQHSGGHPDKKIKYNGSGTTNN